MNSFNVVFSLRIDRRNYLFSSGFPTMQLSVFMHATFSAISSAWFHYHDIGYSIKNINFKTPHGPSIYSCL
jgi:hypothetical protein